MKIIDGRVPILDPLERFSEILFGLIMVLSFTCVLSVSEGGRSEIHEMFLAALGCNFAWGIIDAVFYLIGCLTHNSRAVALLRLTQRCNDPLAARQLIEREMPAKVAEALHDSDFARIHQHLKRLPAPREKFRLMPENGRGAIGVFLLVFLSTFPVVIPFLVFRNARLALHVSNGIALLLLFWAGYMLAEYAGMRRTRTGLTMVVLGGVLVAITIALGG